MLRHLTSRHSCKQETLTSALARVVDTVARDRTEITLFHRELFHPIGVPQLGSLPQFLPAGRTVLTADPVTKKIAPSCTVLGPLHPDRNEVLGQSTGIGCSLDAVSGSMRDALDYLGAQPQPDSTGRRPGLMMTLAASHPAAVDFINAKWRFYATQTRNSQSQSAPLAQMNLSLRIPDGVAGEEFLASDTFSAVCRAAHAVGDPGILFEGAVADEPAPDANQPWRRATATSPCGELWLHEGECCTLGNLVLPAFLEQGGCGLRFNWRRLEQAASVAVVFLDGVIDCLVYPSEQLRVATQFYRRVGLGVMGWATCLKLLGIGYDTVEARALAGEIAARIYNAALRSSERLAELHGSALPPVPSLDHTHQPRIRRNVSVLAFAPTGGTSHLLGVSSSIEPYFNDAHDVPPTAHLLMMAAFQQHVDNGVSKTVNLHKSASVRDVAEVFLQARELGLKGVTVFRDGCLECAPRPPVVCVECTNLPH